MTAADESPGDVQTRRLAWAVLALWTVTDITGLKMLHTFVSRGGLQDPRLDTTYPAGLVANASLGTAASMLWTLYLVTRKPSLAHAAVGQFGAAVAAGTALAVPWHLAERAGRPSRRAGGPEALRYGRIVEAGHAGLAWVTTGLAAVVAVRLKHATGRSH